MESLRDAGRRLHEHGAWEMGLGSPSSSRTIAVRRGLFLGGFFFWGGGGVLGGFGGFLGV